MTPGKVHHTWRCVVDEDLIEDLLITREQVHDLRVAEALARRRQVAQDAGHLRNGEQGIILLNPASTYTGVVMRSGSTEDTSVVQLCLQSANNMNTKMLQY